MILLATKKTISILIKVSYIKIDMQSQSALSSVSVTVFYVHSQSETRLPSPAPPPKLHYSTFWRSVGKRIYILHMEEVMQSAKALSPKLRTKLQ